MKTPPVLNTLFEGGHVFLLKLVLPKEDQIDPDRQCHEVQLPNITMKIGT